MVIVMFQYFILVVVVFIMEVVAGVLAFAYSHDIETVLSDELLRGIRTQYPTDNEPDETGLQAAWNLVQSTVCSILLSIVCETRSAMVLVMNRDKIW